MSSQFQIYPAIDLLNGACVRLYQGDYEQKTVYNDSPLAQALQFEKEGASWLHIVDLNGAKDGATTHKAIIEEIVQNTNLKIQVGGGIRTEETIAAYLEMGVTRVILGSVAHENPSFVQTAVQKFGAERIVVGIDTREGNVSVNGWLETTAKSGVELAKELANFGVQTFICTDIATDGTLGSPNIALCEEIAHASGAEVIVSGGVGNLKDIGDVRLAYAKSADVKEPVSIPSVGRIGGVIVGKALYTKQFTLQEAIEEGATTC